MGELLSGIPNGVLASWKKCNLISQNIITVLIFWPKSYPSYPGGRGYFDTTEKCTFNHKNLNIEVSLVYPKIFKTKIQLYRVKWSYFLKACMTCVSVTTWMNNGIMVTSHYYATSAQSRNYLSQLDSFWTQASWHSASKWFLPGLEVKIGDHFWLDWSKWLFWKKRSA